MEGASELFVQFLVPLLTLDDFSVESLATRDYTPLCRAPSNQAGGIAGTTVDVVLFPLDTIKTRLQSSKGFWAAGGFRQVYAGILPAAAGSAPSAATFFCMYELTKSVLAPRVSQQYIPLIHMLAASAGEMVSNMVRVPFEVTKQRCQANRHVKPSEVIRQTLQSEGVRGLYRGYFTTISREIPFSFIQYPVWEYFKASWGSMQGSPVQPWQGAVCGAFAGGIAAAITTPLDVAKTRVMLAKAGDSEVRLSILQLLVTIGRNEGIRGLFSGFVPRVSWISLGGFVFLGAYEQSRHVLLRMTVT